MKLSPHEIAWLATFVNVPDVRPMTRGERVMTTAIILAESGGETDVIGFSPSTSAYYGNADHGIGQISGWWAGARLQSFRWRDPFDNMRMFKLIWKDAGYTFEPWNVTADGAPSPATEKWMMAAEVGMRFPFMPVNPHTAGWRLTFAG